MLNVSSPRLTCTLLSGPARLLSHAATPHTASPTRAMNTSPAATGTTACPTVVFGRVNTTLVVSRTREAPLSRRRGQARPRRPRQGGQDHHPGPARRRVRGHLHRPAPD